MNDNGSGRQEYGKEAVERARKSELTNIYAESPLDYAFGVIYQITDWTPSQGTVDFSAGFGDTISFSLTKQAREYMDIDSVDYSSDAYSYGEYAGYAHGAFAGFAHFGRHAWNVGVKKFFWDKRTYGSVQRQWSQAVGGYKGKYELHHWFTPQSFGGTSAGWNIVTTSSKLNRAMGNGGWLFNVYKTSIIGVNTTAISGATAPLWNYDFD